MLMFPGRNQAANSRRARVSEAYCLVCSRARTDLDSLSYVFALPTSKFMKYQVRHAIPYFIKRWILFQRSATIKPLYQFEGKPAQEKALATDSPAATSPTGATHLNT